MATATFTNANGIPSIDATTVVQTLSVSGVGSFLGELTVTLTGLNTTWGNDLDLLLVAPNGNALLLISDVINNGDFDNATITLSDAGSVFPSTSQVVSSGIWRPTNYGGSDVFAVPYVSSGPDGAGTLASVFNGIDPNGQWTLHFADDDPLVVLSLGSWSLNITTLAAPTFTDLGPTAFFDVDSPDPTVLDADALISDLDLDPLADGNGNYAGTTLTIQRAGGANLDDSFGFTNGFFEWGGQVQDSDNIFGNVTMAGGMLVIEFTGSPSLPTSTVVNAILRSITYSNANLGLGQSVTLEYTFEDETGATATGSLDVDAVKVSRAPDSADATVQTDEDTPYVFGTSDFAFTDTDAPAESFAGVVVSSLPFAGTLLLDGVAVAAGDEISAADIAAGKLTFAPAENANGTGYASFTFQVRDTGSTDFGGVNLDPTPNTITIDVAPVADAPVTTDDSYAATEDTALTIAGPGVLGNDTDADGDALSAVVVSGPAHGSLVLNADGSFTYTPDADFNGSDSFTYKANDGTADGNVAIVSLAVGAVNDAPVGSPTAMLADGFEDQPYIVSAADLLDGFSDPEGDPLSVQNLAVVGGGSVADNGDGTYTITLPPDRAGSVTLTYQVSDGQGGLTPAVQGYEVIGDGDEAVFSGDTAGAVVEAGLAGPGIATATGTLGVSDVDGLDTLVPILAGSRSIWGYGSVEMTKDGAWTYTLDNSHPKVDALKAGETLSDRFVAVAADGTQQVVVITISGADDGVRSVPGTPGDDTLVSTSADESLLGGRGLDTAVFTGALAGYELTRLGDGSVKIVDIDPSDGDDGTDTLSSIELLRFGTAEPVTIGSLVGQPDWTLDKADVALTAAAYQFFTGALPSAAGFEYLILSSANPNDLNDPYYASFNLENLYLNFASNLGTAGAGASFFDAEYGALSFEATVKAAYLDIVGTELTGAALDFFLDAEGFYQSVAASRVVRPGVDLAEATKIVAIGSILHEAVKADSGVLGQAVNDFAAIVNAAGTAEDFGHSLFATV